MSVIDELDNKFKIRLEGKISGKLIVFNTMPTLSEHNSASYESVALTHLIGNYYAYNNSPSRTFDMGDIKLVSRNGKEARRNLERVLLLRSWTKSYFGNTVNGPNEKDDLMNWLGAPPEVLLFSAYSTDTNRGNINKVPVVLEKFSMTYPNDVDYIPTDAIDANDVLGGTPFPILTTISISLLEQHSASDFERFNLHSYRNGVLDAF